MGVLKKNEMPMPGSRGRQVAGETFQNAVAPSPKTRRKNPETGLAAVQEGGVSPVHQCPHLIEAMF